MDLENQIEYYGGGLVKGSLTLVGGEPATGTQMGGTGIYLIYYAKDCNLMQLVTVEPTTAP